MRAVSLLTNISISESAEENKQYSVVFTAGPEARQEGGITVSSTTARKILWALADQLRVDLLTPLRSNAQDSSEEDLFVPDESNQLSDELPSTSQVVGWTDVCQKVEGSTDDELGGRFEYESAGSTTSKKKRIRTRRSLRKMDFVDTFEEETPTMRLVCVAPPAGKAEDHTSKVPLPWRDVDHSFKPLGVGDMIEVLAQLPAAEEPVDPQALPGATPKRSLGSETDSNQKAAVEPFSKNVDPSSKNVDPSVYKVHLGKIIHGQDTRTTLMIRNIPNKLTLDDLLELLADFEDILDFVYVPIDFKNKSKFCNVGYGFINFPDYSKIPVFYMRFQGKRWTSVHSTKICALTYGRLQGKLDLLQHFALSNVMYQPQKMRPIFRMDNDNDADRVVTAYYPHLAEMAVGDMRTVRWLHLGEKANEDVVMDRPASSPKSVVEDLDSAGTESSGDVIRDFSCDCPCALTRTEAQIQMQLVRDELSQLQPELLVLEGQRTCLDDVLSSTTLLPSNRGLAERFLSKVEHRVGDIESRLLQLLQRAVLIARHLIKTPAPDEDLDGLAEDQKRLLLGLEVTADSSDGREEVMSEIREKQADIRREAERLRRSTSRRIEDQICGQMDRILEHRHPMIPANAKEIQDRLAVVVDSMFGKGQQTVRIEDVNTLLDNRPDLRLAWSVNTNEFTGVDVKDISVEVHLSETLAKILSR
ncbi:MAG: uncharacterized protein KVP18_001193 [Porospora cf. gigantea A]|uniref:uncharacterized protein n=1 Tax=Porospora cf. gigantea A TaxID=2853593 RepID=UPI003559B084|nr:MAG: hypothetical protein KVP18_001193 [Porospora cf. gigantea A]